MFYILIKPSKHLILQNKDLILKNIESVRYEDLFAKATFLTRVHILK